MSADGLLRDLLAAKDMLLNAPRRPQPPAIHPRMHALACDLLGVPHESPLTERDLWRALEIERHRAKPTTTEGADL